MSDVCLVDSCDRPVEDAYVCQRCANRLSVDLGDIPALVAELDLVLTRQTRLGDRAGSRSTERPVPYDARASEVGTQLRVVLVGWTRVLLEEHGGQAPADTFPAIAMWLLARVEQLRHHEAGYDAVAEIASAVERVRRIIDRPIERIYAGPCNNHTPADDVYGDTSARRECGADLYAKPGAAIVRCRECDAEYDVPARREWMLAAVEWVQGTATEIARALSVLDRPVTASQIRGYAYRGRLTAHGVDVQGRPMYRFGDVRDLLAQQSERRIS